jgi:hypothetical protein
MTKLDDLIARIRADVVIRRTKSGNATVETAKQRMLREARERGASDPALRLLMAAANAKAKTFSGAPVDLYANFSEIAHTPLLQRQVCRSCGEARVNVVGEMLHLRGVCVAGTPPVDVWVRRSTLATLPIEEPLWAPTQSIAHCVDCINERREEQLATFGPFEPAVEASGQLPLFN